MTTRPPGLVRLAWVNADRELLSHRANRFLYWHLALLLAVGSLAVGLAPAAEVDGAAWFILSGVLYVLSLSSLLLGLSSAQAEAEELPFLATQPMGFGPWLVGKTIGLLAVALPSAALLLVPWWIFHGWTPVLAKLALAAGGVCAVFALLGLAIGLWVRDQVRGLLVALGGWFILLFGLDLGLLLAAGIPWVREHAELWVVPLMANPLDSFRIAVMLALEDAAFNPLGAGRLVTWWTSHAGLWLTLCLLSWGTLAWLAARWAVRNVPERD